MLILTVSREVDESLLPPVGFSVIASSQTHSLARNYIDQQLVKIMLILRQQPVLTRAIHWDLIRQQYDQMIKYATALRLGTAETEVILKRFNRSNIMHPTNPSFG